MAKAVLVMDNPESCFECNFLYCDGDANLDSCQAREEARPVDSETYKKPDWCPLRELPEKKEELSVEKYEFGGLGKAFTSGWNACLDEILKEPQKKGVASKRGNPAG